MFSLFSACLLAQNTVPEQRSRTLFSLPLLLLSSLIRASGMREALRIRILSLSMKNKSYYRSGGVQVCWLYGGTVE